MGSSFVRIEAVIRCLAAGCGLILFPNEFISSAFGAMNSTDPPVTVTEDAGSYTLANGIVTARVDKRSGDLVSLGYKNLEMLQPGSRGAVGGYWSHDVSRGDRSGHITIDPKGNGGERGEVSVQGRYNGRPLGSGPGGGVKADIEIRYTLARNDSGIYTYCVFTHATNHPATSVGEARFCAKLNDDLFDWMTVDSNRNLKVITAYDWNHGTVMNFKEARRMNSGQYKGQVEHKYDYSANQFETRAWGWTSSEKQVGLWFINPTTEYLSGGPTKVELSAHRDATFGHDTNAPAPPCLLNYWRSSHYGGSVCAIARGEAWTKVIGPFLIYCNSAQTRDAMWKDSLARSEEESKSWPYDWVAGVDYPRRIERGIVRGQLVLHDPQAPDLNLDRWLVGLSAPEYSAPPFFHFGAPGRRGPGGSGGSAAKRVSQRSSGDGSRDATDSDSANEESLVDGVGPEVVSGPDAMEFGSRTNHPGGGRRGSPAGFGPFRFGPQRVDWQNDAKHYQFWVRGDARGHFAIPNVRPGRYTLHALANGVLGEFALTNVTVEAGQILNLGKLNWQPLRHGKQLWDIGIPNRTASEFFKGDDYYHWGWYLEYPKLFPNDVNYVVGRSDFRKDWFFEQVPHNEIPTHTTGTGFGRSTTWSIAFDLAGAPRGNATLRLAICGVGTPEIAVSLNGQSVGAITGLVYNATIHRDGIGGSWTEKDLAFDASRMKAGRNVLQLTVPEGSLGSGIMYDYLRLELDKSSGAASAQER
jgi:rhamnogalacturonan endolyase